MLEKPTQNLPVADSDKWDRVNRLDEAMMKIISISSIQDLQVMFNSKQRKQLIWQIIWRNFKDTIENEKEKDEIKYMHYSDI